MFSVYAWAFTLRAQRAAPPVEHVRYTFSQKSKAGPRFALPGHRDRDRLRDVRRAGHALGGGGAVAVLALVLVIVIYRQWRLADQWRIFRETVRESSMILMIIGAAAVFSYMLSLLYVTQSRRSGWSTWN